MPGQAAHLADRGGSDGRAGSGSGRHAQGRVHPGERHRAPLVGAARSLLCHLAHEPRQGRPHDRHDLWRRRQRVVWPCGLEVHRSRRELDPFERGPGLRRRRDADPLGLEHRRVRRHGLCRRRARRPVPQRRSRPVLAPRRGPARPPLAAGMAAGRRWADPPLAGDPPRRPGAALGRDLDRRRVPHRPTAASPGRPATAAPAATTCPRSSATPRPASACTI